VYLQDIDFDVEDFIKDAQQNKDAKVEFWSVPNLYDKHQNVFDHFFAQRLSRIEENNLPLKSALDVGIGYGFWANYLNEHRGIKTDGLDIELGAVKYCNETYKLDSLHQSFESFETDKKFDAIFMFDVLEHFVSPQDMLEKAKSMLNDEGFIYIQVPNVLGLKVPFGHGLGLPYHLWQFDHANIKKLFKKVNLEVVQYWTGNQGIIGHYEKGGPSLMRQWYWNIGNFLRRGNRLQVIVKPSF
jgi:2-polyprenyl-3-methyl-5-hydroxy-6-metoxy-1,4-benzoquinol methylase